MRTQILPLSPFEIFRTNDLAEAAVNVRPLLSPHSVRAIGRPGRIDVRYHFVELRNIAVIYAQYGAAVRIDPGVLENFYLVGMPIAGRGLVTCGDREIEQARAWRRSSHAGNRSRRNGPRIAGRSRSRLAVRPSKTI